MRADAALVLISMGFQPDVHFLAVNGTPTSCDIVALNGTVLPTEAEIEAAAPNMATNLLNISHSRLVSMLANGPDSAKLLRALLLITLDEFNLHAAKINAILTAIDSGSTLAQVKTNIAAIADYPTRTKANLITAMTNKINAGDADA